MQVNFNRVLDTVRDTAANVATKFGAGINSIYNNPHSNYHGAKEAIKNAHGSGFLPIPPPPASVTRRYLRDAHWSMLVPFFVAMLVLSTLLYRMLTGLCLSSGNEQHLASLIPLFIIFRESMMSKALAICTTTPCQDSPHLWLWLALVVPQRHFPRSRRNPRYPPEAGSRVQSHGHGIRSRSRKQLVRSEPRPARLGI
jgi:hypothetical protein